MFDNNPRPLPIKLISALMQQRHGASGTMLPPISFSERYHFELCSGPFANFIAPVDTIDPKQRIWVVANFKGKKPRTQIATVQLQPAK